MLQLKSFKILPFKYIGMMHFKAISFLSIMAFRTSNGFISSCIQKQLSHQQLVSSTVLLPPLHQQNMAHQSSTASGDDKGIGIDKNEDGENELMVNVTLETASQQTTLKVQKGEVLRTALLRRGASPHNGRARLINCRGLGTCGTCAVEIEAGGDGAIAPYERNTKERLRLNFPPHGSPDQSPNLRLACQVQVQDDISVRKRTGFWGQDTEELAEAYDAELWFGDLEYVLDNKSPPKEK